MSVRLTLPCVSWRKPTNKPTRKPRLTRPWAGGRRCCRRWPSVSKESGSSRTSPSAGRDRQSELIVKLFQRHFYELGSSANSQLLAQLPQRKLDRPFGNF